MSKAHGLLSVPPNQRCSSVIKRLYWTINSNKKSEEQFRKVGP